MASTPINTTAVNFKRIDGIVAAGARAHAQSRDKFTDALREAQQRQDAAPAEKPVTRNSVFDVKA